MTLNEGDSFDLIEDSPSGLVDELELDKSVSQEIFDNYLTKLNTNEIILFVDENLTTNQNEIFAMETNPAGEQEALKSKIRYYCPN